MRLFSRKQNGVYFIPSWNLLCNCNNISARTEVGHVITPLDRVQNCNDHVKLMHTSAVSYRLNNEMFWRFLFQAEANDLRIQQANTRARDILRNCWTSSQTFFFSTRSIISVNRRSLILFWDWCANYFKSALRRILIGCRSFLPKQVL